jgi:hypothetical protein
MTDQIDHTKLDWKPIETAPYQKVIALRNHVMKDPAFVLGTRGFATGRGIHPNQSFCTTVYSPDPRGSIFSFPAGKLMCADEWAEVPA